MDKISLTNNSKKILRAIKDGNVSIQEKDYQDINLLQQECLIDAKFSEFGTFLYANITSKGEAYIHSNPKLKNPSIWDDKKYCITTFISIILITITIIIAICK